jgi:hypothetical protein
MKMSLLTFLSTLRRKTMSSLHTVTTTTTSSKDAPETVLYPKSWEDLMGYAMDSQGLCTLVTIRVTFTHPLLFQDVVPLLQESLAVYKEVANTHMCGFSLEMVE